MFTGVVRLEPVSVRVENVDNVLKEHLHSTHVLCPPGTGSYLTLRIAFRIVVLIAVQRLDQVLHGIFYYS